jgi:thiol-disulfide isomerase/thioredoxin
LTGIVEGLPDGAHIQLTPISHDSEKPIADTVVAGGKFVFRGAVEEPLLVNLGVADTYGRYNFILENGKLKLTGKAILNRQDNNTRVKFEEMNLEGSPLTVEYKEKMSVRLSLDSLHKAFNERYKDITAAVSAARGAKDQAKLDSCYATEEYKGLAAAEKDFFSTVESTYEKMIMDNKDTFWGPLLMVSLMSYLTDEQKPWYEALSPEAKESYYGRKVKEELYPTDKVGSKAPGFTVKDQEGKSVTLTGLCNGKKYILIDFWASWCNPCRKEIPSLKKLYAGYANKGFQIISISIDKKEADWLKALKEEQLSWPNFRDTEGVADLYKVKLIPTMYLIDAEGVVLGENLRGTALAGKLAELFK